METFAEWFPVGLLISWALALILLLAGSRIKNVMLKFVGRKSQADTIRTKARLQNSPLRQRSSNAPASSVPHEAKDSGSGSDSTPQAG
jgi:hypothetical protein